MTTNSPVNSIAPFLQTSIFFPEEFDEFRAVFLQAYRNIANTINVREIAIFDLTENLTGIQWPVSGNPQIKRQPFRKVFFIGAIATGATSTTAHGLTFTEIVGHNAWCITDVVDYRPIPYSSATAVNEQIEIKLTATNIIIISGAAAPNITSVNLELTYLKN